MRLCVFRHTFCHAIMPDWLNALTLSPFKKINFFSKGLSDLEGENRHL
jgi:hypothetical protein